MVTGFKRSMVGLVGALVLRAVCLGAATAPAQASSVSIHLVA